MVIPGHMGGISQFWLHIQNPLKIWCQDMHRGAHMVSLWVNLILELWCQNSCSKGHRPDMKVPSSDPESTHQIGLDYVKIMWFGEGRLMSSMPSIDLAVAIAVGQLWIFQVWILNLLNNGSRYKFNHSIQKRSPNTHFSHHYWSSHIGRRGENFEFPHSNLDSPPKTSLDASWNIPIREHFLTPFQKSNHHFGCSTCYRLNQTFLFVDSESPQNLSLDTSQTVPNRGGQISHELV